MVTTHTPGNDAGILASKCVEYFQKFGRDDFVLKHFTTTKTASGRLKERTSTEKTIVGDLQFGSKQLRSYIYQGIAKTGDGIFFTLGTNEVSLDDEITVSGKSWKLTRQVEGEDINKKVPYTGWIAILIPKG